MTLRVGILSLVFAMLLFAIGIASAETMKIAFSGYGISFGRKDPARGASGWTLNGSPNGWEPRTMSNGGTVEGTVYLLGRPGLGETVRISHGNWTCKEADGRVFKGKITGGSVRWPESESDLGCGANNGRFVADVALDGGGTGNISACVNDANGLAKPLIWGNIQLNGTH
jgi:hypothetical protein